MVCHRSGECWNVVNWPLGTNFSEILLDMYTFSFRKTHLKMPSGKWHFVSAPMYWVLVYSQGVRTSSVSPVWPLVAQIAKFMEPTWGPPGSCRPQMGPMLAPWTLLSGRPSSGTMLATELHIFLPRLSGFLWSLVIFVDVIQNGWRDLKTYRSTSNVNIYPLLSKERMPHPGLTLLVLMLLIVHVPSQRDRGYDQRGDARGEPGGRSMGIGGDDGDSGGLERSRRDVPDDGGGVGRFGGEQWRRMRAMASQITGNPTVCSIVCPDAHQGKLQSGGRVD